MLRGLCCGDRVWHREVRQVWCGKGVAGAAKEWQVWQVWQVVRQVLSVESMLEESACGTERFVRGVWRCGRSYAGSCTRSSAVATAIAMQLAMYIAMTRGIAFGAEKVQQTQTL